MARWTWIACVWLGLVARASAQPAALPLELEWRAPGECPTALDVRMELERIARVRPGYTLRPLAASAAISRRPFGFHAALNTAYEGRRGERTLEAGDCQTLVRSITLVLALTFGPAVELEREERFPTPAPPPPRAAPAPVAGPASEAEAEPERERSAAPTLTVILNAAGSLNLFPSAAAAAAAGLQVAFGSLAVEGRAQLYPSLASALTPAIRVHHRALAGAVSLCHLSALSATLGLTACAGSRLTSLTLRTTGALEAASASGPWTAMTAAALLSWPRRQWLQARLELTLAVSVTRPRFVIEGFGDAHRVPLVVPEAGLSLLLTP